MATLAIRCQRLQGIVSMPMYSLYIVWATRVWQWWEHSPPTIVARVQLPASKPYVGWVCCWFLSFAPRGFSPGTLVSSSPQKTTLSNSNSIWNARTRFNEFIRIPKCFVGKQITIYNFFGFKEQNWTIVLEFNWCKEVIIKRFLSR